MAVPDSSAKKLYVVSAYKEKESNSTDQVLNMPNSPQLTPKTQLDSHGVTYNTTVSHKNDNVNSQKSSLKKIRCERGL